MRDGVDVIGYLYWSLLENWELQENYRPEARFGLFHVERDPSDPQRCLGPCHRGLTEGALAYRQVIMESERSGALGRPTVAALASAERRFGTYTRDGRAIVPPRQTYARVWEGRTSAGSRLELVLMRTDVKPSWLVLIYWCDPGIWHSATFAHVDGARVLRETWYDDEAHRWQTRDHRLSSHARFSAGLSAPANAGSRGRRTAFQLSDYGAGPAHPRGAAPLTASSSRSRTSRTHMEGSSSPTRRDRTGKAGRTSVTYS
jgi:Glycosyl hydrolase family 1